MSKTLTHGQFIDKYNGNRIDYDGIYGFQCVDLVRAYDNFVLGYQKLGRFGHAIENFENKTGFYNDDWEKIKVENLTKGDSIFVAASSSNGGYGHIAIVNRWVNNNTIEIFEQNAGSGNGDGLGSNAPRLKIYNKSIFIGGWRYKLKDRNIFENDYIKILGDVRKEVGVKFLEKWNLENGVFGTNLIGTEIEKQMKALIEINTIRTFQKIK